MNKNLQHIDRIFHDHLYRHKEDAPVETWNFIKNELNKKDAALYKSKYLLLKKIFICVVLTTVFVLLYNSLQPVLYNTKFPETINNNQMPQPHALLSDSNNINFYKANSNIAKSNSIKVIQLKKLNNLIPVKAADKEEEQTSFFASKNDYQETFAQVNSPEEPSLNPLNDMVAIDIKKLADKKADVKENATKQAAATIIKLKKNSAFYLVPYFSFDHVRSHIKQNYVINNANIASQDYNKEKLDPAYTAGLLFEYGISKKISLQFGALYSKWYASISPSIVTALQQNSGSYKFKLSTDYGYADLKHASVNNPQYNDSIKITSGTVNLQAFSMPLIAQINIKSAKLKLNAQLGGAVNIITSNAAELEYISKDKKETETIERLHGLRRTYFSAISGAEVSYSITKRTDVGLNPF